ncbi:MAG: proton-conducting transporter membrane subunit [Planctomycetota bacterium]
MTNRWIVLMVVLPMLTGALSVPIVRRLHLSRVIGMVGLSATLATSVLLLWKTITATGPDGELPGAMVSQMGQWAAPMGITLVFDAFSGMLLVAAAFVFLCGYLASFGELKPTLERRYFHPLLHFMHAGVNLSFLTGDLFNLFVAFEIMLMASYGLVCLAAGRERLVHAYKYVVLNLLASALFVTSAGLVYGMFGTLNLAHLMDIVNTKVSAGEPLPDAFVAVSVLLLTVFGLKAAVFPLFFWLPDAYPTLPTPLLAIFGGVLTKVGIYVLARTFPPIFMVGEAGEVAGPMLLFAAVGTMLLAGAMAVAYRKLRGGLCMMVVVGVGFSIAGVAVGGDVGLSGVAFYASQSMIAAALAFVLCGKLEAHTGGDDLDGPNYGGLWREVPWLAVFGFVALLTLVGLPPLSGFYGKLWIIQAAFGGDTASSPNAWVAFAALLTGAITLLAVLRWWSSAFWLGAEHGRTSRDDVQTGSRCLSASLGLLLAASLALGLFAQPALSVAKVAGDRLASPDGYIQAVLDPIDLETPKLVSAKPYGDTKQTTQPKPEAHH